MVSGEQEGCGSATIHSLIAAMMSSKRYLAHIPQRSSSLDLCFDGEIRLSSYTFDFLTLKVQPGSEYCVEHPCSYTRAKSCDTDCLSSHVVSKDMIRTREESHLRVFSKARPCCLISFLVSSEDQGRHAHKYASKHMPVPPMSLRTAPKKTHLTQDHTCCLPIEYFV